MRPEHRGPALVQTVERVLAAYAKDPSSDHKLEAAINDTLYHERRRLERERPSDPKVQSDLTFYQQVQRELRDAEPADRHRLLARMARHFADEVVGNFDERVYRIATRAIPAGLSVMLHAMSPTNLHSFSSLKNSLSEHVVIQGAIDHAKALLDRGTLIVVPTHSSHLDSIVLGYAVHLLGMPPLLYGAGLNLFNNPFMSFFMSHLGAYRVDRKKSAALYKDVLKEYTTLSLELGYSNLFFPGGTRSRSGAVETKLKKGLLGTGLRAFQHNLSNAKAKPQVYVQPCTISYKLVLEAETLIDDYLKEIGKSRYIIEDDEFSRPRRVLNFLANIVRLEGQIVITFGAPLDVIGNRVDREGRSLDPRGRPIDPAHYLSFEGRAQFDEQRDAQYTRELSAEIAAAFLRDSVVMSTHIVGYALLDLLRRKNPELDLYRLLRTGGAFPSVSSSELARHTECVLHELRELPQGPRLGEELKTHDAESVVTDALRYFSSYHTEPAATRQGDQVFHQHRNLLLYYGNRLAGYGLERRLGSERPKIRP